MKEIVSFLFFVSGIAGLIYEVVWAKHLSLLLGNTTLAHTMVLATFMGGLALGYYLFGKIADKAESALNLYGWMEIGIGLCGLLFVPILEWVGRTYVSLAIDFGGDSIFASSFKWSLSIVLLLIPALLMGGTLPILGRSVVRSIGQVESEIAWLYFLNSIGAVAGSLLTGFVLIPRYGLNLSITVAVTLNLLVGLIALSLRLREKQEKERAAVRTIPDSSPPCLYNALQIRVAVFGIALSGAAALIYEIAWIRLLSLVLGSSAYSFSLMLAAFIAGIALGSFIVSQRWALKCDSYLLFALAELSVALSIILILPLYERLPFYFVLLANLFVRAPETFWLYELIKFLICFLLMLFPTLFLGMTLPLASQIATRNLRKVGEDVGSVFAANTLGTLLGAAAAGLVLLPLLGIRRLIDVGVLINLLVGVSALWAGPALTLRKKATVAGVSCALCFLYLYSFPAWDRNLLSSGVFRERRFLGGLTYAEFQKGHQDDLLYYKDGANMTVAVDRMKNGQIILKVNGKPDASSKGDLPTQILSGQIPLLLRPEARNVLIIGLGSGITAGSVLRHPVQALDLVEISPEVVEANRFFAPHNYDALKDPRLRLHIEDGKTFLKTTKGQFDVIISEPSNPWIAGIGNLFSIEFYQDVRKRLKPDGLIVQWFHTYEMTDDILRLLLRTFTISFEHVTLWSPLPTDILLIGSKIPPPIDFNRSLTRFSEVKVKEDLIRLGIETFPTILSLQVASDEVVRRAAGKGRVNEDLFPILEYQAPKAFFLGQISQFLLPYDERRSQHASHLYFAEFLKRNALSREEIKDSAIYHQTYGSLNRLDLASNFVDLWLKKAPNDAEAHWALARIEEDRGNLDAARKQLQYLLKVNPDHHEYLRAAARLEFQAYLTNRSMLTPQTPNRALTYLHRLLDLDGDRKDAVYRSIGQIHVVEGDYKSAIDYLERAATYAQNNRGEFQPETLWLEAADLALEMNNIATAISYVRKAVAINPQNNVAKRKLATLIAMRLGP